MSAMFETALVSQREMSTSNDDVSNTRPPGHASDAAQFRNNSLASVTRDTSQSGASTHPTLAPHRGGDVASRAFAQLGSLEQHASPLGTAEMHPTTAARSCGSVSAHVVSAPRGSSPAGRVAGASQGAHRPRETRSFSAHDFMDQDPGGPSNAPAPLGCPAGGYDAAGSHDGSVGSNAQFSNLAKNAVAPANIFGTPVAERPAFVALHPVIS
jgi:hypothetical protein